MQKCRQSTAKNSRILQPTDCQGQKVQGSNVEKFRLSSSLEMAKISAEATKKPSPSFKPGNNHFERRRKWIWILWQCPLKILKGCDRNQNQDQSGRYRTESGIRVRFHSPSRTIDLINCCVIKANQRVRLGWIVRLPRSRPSALLL